MPSLSAQGSVNLTADRIQIDQWVDSANNIVNPLTEIVEMKNASRTAGTGTFLAECRVMTALHVLLAAKDRPDEKNGGQKSYDLLADGESLVGDKFEFETRPVPGGEKKRRGSFTVIGHGQLKLDSPALGAMEDWAIGYDEECLSDKLGLGHVKYRAVFLHS